MDGKRLGRGEALRKLFERQAPPPAHGGIDQSSTSSSREPVCRDSAAVAPPPRPSGRSALFAQYCKPKDDVGPPPVSSSSQNPSRGRAVFASLAASHYRRPEREVELEKLTRHIGDVRISDDDEPRAPVIQKGTFGREARLAVNYVRLKFAEGKGLFQYAVQYDPPVEHKGARFGLLNECKHLIGEIKLFDGAILYLPFQLPQKTTIHKSKLQSDGSPVTISITFVKQRKLGDPESIHLYNVLFRKIMVILGLALHGNNFYDPKAAMPIPSHMLEVWPGFITAIDEFEGGLMLCCDASHRVLRNQTVLDLMNDLEMSNRPSWKTDFVNLILGQSVLTRYNNKLYRIDDIDFDQSPKYSFERSNGEKMTYMQYYKQQYNLSIKDQDQPLLISKPKKRINGMRDDRLVSLIPELCYLTGITDAMRADMRVMKDITQCICVNPNQRHVALSKFISNIKGSREASKILSDWGLSIDDAYLHLPGRTLPPVDINFGRGFSARGSVEANWSGPCNKNSVLSAVDLLNWTVVCTRRDDRSVAQFVDQMIKFGPQVGLKITKPETVCMGDDRTDSYIKTLRSVLAKGSPQAVLVVFPIARTDKYSAVKKLCCIEEPIPSQAILTRTIRKAEKSRAVVLKVALQINCKLGGTLWSTNIPVQSSMVCGLDTYHDPKRKLGSVGALVCSSNATMTRWFSKAFVQSPGMEVVNGLEMCMVDCLLNYKQMNNHFPEQIMLYRDGVSDGQLDVCKQFELTQIMKACKRISAEYIPKVLFVIVQKRINTRLFSFDQKSGYGNPPPGTILDHTVTRKYLYDFFLVSQHVTQGTVSPTHFIVLHNTTMMSPDQIQRFSYTLTHLYYNWPGTIRVPAPCQYAHKLAYLIGENIQKEAAEVLCDKLFYL